MYNRKKKGSEDMEKKMIALVTWVLALSMLVGGRAYATDVEDQSSLMFPEWMITLFEDKAQDNKMLERAFEDYKTIPDNFKLADMGTLETGSLYNEVLTQFKPGEDVEVSEQSAGDGTSSISFVYRAEEGDMNPLRGIEDWAQVDFYFVGDNLIYTGITTLSLGFMGNEMITQELHDQWYSEGSAIEEISQADKLEIDGIGQILVNGEYAYGIGYPKEADPIGEGGLLVIQDGVVTEETTVDFARLQQYSFSGFIYNTLVTEVDNEVFEPLP